MIAQQLYELTPRDEQVTPLEIFNYRAVTNGNLATLTLDVPVVPLGRVLLLQYVHTLVAPSATQNISSYFLTASVNGVGDVTLLNEYAGGVEPFSTSHASMRNYVANVFLKPGTVIRLEGAFNAGVTTNTIELSLSGILIPRGNIAI